MFRTTATAAAAGAARSAQQDDSDRFEELPPDPKPASAIASPTEPRQELRAAIDYKLSGNAAFARSSWAEAADEYRLGLASLPARPVPRRKLDPTSGQPVTARASDKIRPERVRPPKRRDPPPTPDPWSAEPSKLDSSDEDSDDKQDPNLIPAPAVEPIEEEEVPPEAEDIKQLRAVLNGNLGASLMKMSCDKEAVEALTDALTDDPNYVKALHRRAMTNERIAGWSGYSAALEDWRKLSKLSKAPPSYTHIQRLQKLSDEARDKETAEMMTKLKGLGNSFLGKFGMSTDNFQFVKNEDTGGYSMNFNQNARK
ncbi:uncharacterized protein L969DRAFT_83679 [Mixia osmundae IAM 14324]|uniref:Tetratricopeptide repeat protein 1 n=1 Tax=Mixia osmundae (strain CBS 9802 / IAM 14324 / JCM 22182 / KY 12970) TaxID=764103 RepID=G7E4L9_MIXOS|nr:uncharacterized protein L969DRAFT_83679 [Mixia osmundae IAM 14324]KEI41841.1 hypothetical protein L969DRAFT_83679 [Mixia osmundae IAM 14324]GAA97779.1 hypothetical protein E5Q_04458 [Mixia osmundae IAM 14324]